MKKLPNSRLWSVALLVAGVLTGLECARTGPAKPRATPNASHTNSKIGRHPPNAEREPLVGELIASGR